MKKQNKQKKKTEIGMIAIFVLVQLAIITTGLYSCWKKKKRSLQKTEPTHLKHASNAEQC